MANPDSPWKRVSSRTAYQNPWIRVREDQVVRPDGSPGIYGVIETPPSVFIVALNEKNEVYIVRQFRYPTDKFSWEVPAGSSDGQDVLEAAKRELQEETGLTAKTWIEVGTMQAMNGISCEMFHIFLAQDTTQTERHKQEEEGITEMRSVSQEKLLSMIKSGEFDDGQSVTAIMAALLHLGTLTIKST